MIRTTAAGSATGAPHRLRVRAGGTVQGVGFRPHVHRLATDLGLGGFVLNDSRGVLIEVEGPASDLDLFVRRLVDDAPPASSIDSLERKSIEPLSERIFSIAAATGTATIAPKSPPTVPPMSRLTITISGDRPMELRITTGTRTWFSMSWITQHAMATPIASSGDTVSAASTAGIAPRIGPTIGIASHSAATRARSSADGTPRTT